ncbi:glycosyltransferase family 2 protein [Janthinobacterium sp. GB1R12]|uniref:glycosyltransferase family 2 protein n=1 Tax=Janthinobacterium sp. GB1R12 TaxID=3424190 RepID=UPI003F1EF8B6
MTAKVGLVTVLFNSAPVLPGFFESLSKQSFNDYWLFIIDNSIDELSYAAAEEGIAKYGIKNVTLIRNASNVGVATGNNQGIKLSLEMGCEYVLLLNNDIEFKDTGLLNKMLTLADQRQEKLIVPKIYFFDSGKIWCAGGKINPWTGTTLHTGEGDVDKGQFDVAGYTNYAPTCFMLIHRSVFDAIGVMDDKYFVYHDDTDFVWRSNLAKFRIYYWPEGEVWHKVSSSTGGSASPFSIYYGERNRIYFIRKNFGALAKLVAFSYYFATRPLKWKLFSKKLRVPFFKGVLDGLKM